MTGTYFIQHEVLLFPPLCRPITASRVCIHCDSIFWMANEFVSSPPINTPQKKSIRQLAMFAIHQGMSGIVMRWRSSRFLEQVNTDIADVAEKRCSSPSITVSDSRTANPHFSVFAKSAAVLAQERKGSDTEICSTLFLFSTNTSNIFFRGICPS
jgi:hypothetical protein